MKSKSIAAFAAVAVAMMVTTGAAAPTAPGKATGLFSSAPQQPAPVSSAPSTNAEEKRREAREIADLVAQQDMVQIGRWQLWLSLLAVLTAAVSVAFTFVALRQTRQSLDLARETSLA